MTFNEWCISMGAGSGLLMLGVLLLLICALGAYVDGRNSRSHRR